MRFSFPFPINLHMDLQNWSHLHVEVFTSVAGKFKTDKTKG